MKSIRTLLNKWRFYGLGEIEYKDSLEKIFANNIKRLRRINATVVFILSVFVFVLLFLDRSLIEIIFPTGTVTVAALLYVFLKCKYRKLNKENKKRKNLVYLLICLYYVNVISFGIYLDVWAHPGKEAGAFLAVLICALLLFDLPPLFHHCLTICSIAVFIVIISIVKTPAECRVDIPNTMFAGIISLILNWHVIMNRLSLASIAKRMENERDSYYDQSTIDELTQLKNRRDFLNTFQRAVANHRQADNYLCVAILDIDFFKSYNDYYGHPKGDECLREIGRAFRELQSKINIYAARIGGEEFALVWFEEDAANIKNVASMINTTICNLNIPHEKSEAAPYVTASVGIHVVQCGVSDDISTLYDLADKALYIAKKNGRNRAVINYSEHLHIEILRETA